MKISDINIRDPFILNEDGTVCYVKLSDDLTHAVGEPVYMFSGSSPE